MGIIDACTDDGLCSFDDFCVFLDNLSFVPNFCGKSAVEPRLRLTVMLLIMLQTLG